MDAPAADLKGEAKAAVASAPEAKGRLSPINRRRLANFRAQ